MAISLLVDLAPAVSHMTFNTHVPIEWLDIYRQTFCNCHPNAVFTLYPPSGLAGFLNIIYKFNSVSSSILKLYKAFEKELLPDVF